MCIVLLQLLFLHQIIVLYIFCISKYTLLNTLEVLFAVTDPATVFEFNSGQLSPAVLQMVVFVPLQQQPLATGTETSSNGRVSTSLYH